VRRSSRIVLPARQSHDEITRPSTTEARLSLIGAGNSGPVFGVPRRQRNHPPLSYPQLSHRPHRGRRLAPANIQRVLRRSPSRGSRPRRRRLQPPGRLALGLAASGRNPYVLGRPLAANPRALTHSLNLRPQLSGHNRRHHQRPSPAPKVLNGRHPPQSPDRNQAVSKMIPTGAMIKTGDVDGTSWSNVNHPANYIDRAQRISWPPPARKDGRPSAPPPNSSKNIRQS